VITVGWVILEVVSHDPAMEQGRRPVASGDGAEADEKLRAVIVAGHRGDAAAVRRLAEDPSARVRAAALGALGRAGALNRRRRGERRRRPLSRGSPPCLRRDGRARWTG